MSRCTVGEGFPEHCPRDGVYATRWTNGDEGLLCVEHAAWTRVNSPDLESMTGPESAAVWNDMGGPRD